MEEMLDLTEDLVVDQVVSKLLQLVVVHLDKEIMVEQDMEIHNLTLLEEAEVQAEQELMPRQEVEVMVVQAQLV
tara:strand:+ start:318 stop:539 length:222 start_codon:yes stop_codon:yes gene_type:complete